MANYKKVAKLSNTDAAYIAGFIDGDGTITFSRKHKNVNRQLVVSISNTEPNPLEYTLDCVGAGKITRKNPVRTITLQASPIASATGKPLIYLVK